MTIEAQEIPGFPDYLITKDAMVISKKTGKYLVANGNSEGYFLVLLKDPLGVRRGLRIHRLVASAFIDNPNQKPYVNHIDGNRSNNSIDNLEWVTPSENLTHAHKRTGGWGNNKPHK